MKVFKIIGLVLLILILLIIVLGIAAPRKYEVVRSVTIDAPRSLVSMQVMYWKNWQEWSPWAQMDSTMQATVEGVDGTPGSVYKWTGEKAGEGEMMNTGAVPGERIDYHLKFIKPWPSESDGYVEMADAGEGTKVSWSFYGETPFPFNALNLLFSMDKMIGPDFEKGLNLLKGICEKQAELLKTYEIREIRYPARTFAAVREKVAMADFSTFFARSMGSLMQEVSRRGLRVTGAPCGIFFTWDEATQTSDMAAALPVVPEAGGGLTMIRLPDSKALVTDYYGPYEGSANAHFTFDVYIKKNGLTQKLPVIEEYITDPMQEKDSSKWLTRIYYIIE